MNDCQTYVKKTFQGSWTQTSLNTNTFSLGLVQTLSVWRHYWKTQTRMTWCAGRDWWAWPRWGSLTLLGSGQNFRLEKFQMAFYITGNFVCQTGSAASRKSIAYNACKTWRTHNLQTSKCEETLVTKWETDGTDLHTYNCVEAQWSSPELSWKSVHTCCTVVGVCNLWNIVSWQRTFAQPCCWGYHLLTDLGNYGAIQNTRKWRHMLLCNSFTVRQSTVMSGNFLCLK